MDGAVACADSFYNFSAMINEVKEEDETYMLDTEEFKFNKHIHYFHKFDTSETGIKYFILRLYTITNFEKTFTERYKFFFNFDQCSLHINYKHNGAEKKSGLDIHTVGKTAFNLMRDLVEKIIEYNEKRDITIVEEFLETIVKKISKYNYTVTEFDDDSLLFALNSHTYFILPKNFSKDFKVVV